MMRYKSTLSTLFTALVLMGLLAAPAQAQTAGLFAFAQVIHSVPDAGPVDIYVNDIRVIDDLTFQSATGFLPVFCPNTCKITFQLVAGDATDNSDPVFEADAFLDADVYYGIYALGVLAAGEFVVLGLDELRTESDAPNKVEYILIHGVPNAEVDIRTVNMDGEVTELLMNNAEIGDFVGYWQLDPGMHYFNVASSDGNTSLATLGFDVTSYENQTITLLASPTSDSTFTLVGFDSEGNKIEGTAPAREVAAPEAQTLAVEGNYPNPFNPSTAIRFNLTESARVSLEVVDMLGRTVMTLPDQRFEAGVGHTFNVDGSTLASGIYLYRVTARTDARTLLTHTGRMILSK